jgi:hypothetical protein
MGSLIKLALSALAASSQTSALAAFSGRMITGGVLGVVALLLAGAAWGCACAALWIALIPALGPVGAPLLVAGVCLSVAGFLALGAWQLVRRRRARAVNHLQLDAVMAEAGKLIQEHKVEAVVAAIVAGFVAGNSGRKR